jgi:hypothetical protein
MATFFGNGGSAPSSSAQFYGGYIYGERFELTEACTATSLAVRANYGTAGQPFRLCLHADGGANKPTTFKGVTPEFVPDATWTGLAWHTGSITPIVLAPGFYFLGKWFSTTNLKTVIGRSGTSGSSYPGYQAKAYHATNSPGDLTSWSAQECGTTCIVCNYGPAGPPMPLINQLLMGA